MKKVIILSPEEEGINTESSSKFCRSNTLHSHMGRSGTRLALTNGKHPQWQRNYENKRPEQKCHNKQCSHSTSDWKSKGRDKAAEKIKDYFIEQLEVETSRGSQQLLFSILFIKILRSLYVIYIFSLFGGQISSDNQIQYNTSSLLLLVQNSAHHSANKKKTERY